VATPTARTFTLSEPDGAPVTVRVTSGGGRRPVVVSRRAAPELEAKLARAGFAAVAFDPDTPSGLERVLAALAAGTLELGTDRCVLVEPRDHGSFGVTRIAGGARTFEATVGDAAALVSWLATHLV